MTRIFLLRHANAYNENGEQDPESPLIGNGPKQAERLAKRLMNATIEFSFYSPYIRTKQTADAFAKATGLKIVEDDRLKEVGSSDWPSPETFCDPKTLLDFKKTQDIVEDVFLEIVARHKNKTVALFTHGNWIRTLLSRILEGGPEIFTHFVISTASITIVDILDSGFRNIVTVSDGAHDFLL